MRPFCRIRVPGSRLSHTSVSVHFIIALKKCLADQTKRMSLAAVLSWQLGTQMVSLATDGPQDVIGSFQLKGTVGKGTVKGTGRDAETLQLLPEAVC